MYLRSLCGERQDDWADLLPIAEFALNNSFNSSINTTPFKLNTGQNPRLGVEAVVEVRNATAEEFAKGLQAGIE